MATAVFSIVWQDLIWFSVLFWLIALQKKQTLPQWPKGPFAWATLLFLFTFFAGAIFGVHPGQSFQTVHKYLTFLLFFLVGAMSLEEFHLENLIRIFPQGAAVCGLWAIFKHYFRGEDRASSFAGFYMVFGGLLMIALLIQLFLTLKKPKSALQWTITGILSVALLFTQTRGAWVGLVAGIFFWILFRKPKWLIPFGFLLLAAFFILPKDYQNRVRAIWDFSLVYDNQERIYMWKSGFAISKDYPLGIGQGNLGDIYLKYKDPRAKETDIPHLHNNFVQILVQNGWLGLAAYLFWIWAYYFKFFRRGEILPRFEEWNWVFASIFTASLVWGLTEYTFSHQFMNVQFVFLGLQARFRAFQNGSRKGSTLH